MIKHKCLLIASLLSELERWSDLSRNTSDGTEDLDEHSIIDTEDISEHRLGKLGFPSELPDDGVSDLRRIILFSFGTNSPWRGWGGLKLTCLLLTGDNAGDDGETVCLGGDINNSSSLLSKLECLSTCSSPTLMDGPRTFSSLFLFLTLSLEVSSRKIRIKVEVNLIRGYLEKWRPTSQHQWLALLTSLLSGNFLWSKFLFPAHF